MQPSMASQLSARRLQRSQSRSFFAAAANRPPTNHGTQSSDVEVQLQNLRAELQALKVENAELREQNAELRVENAELHGSLQTEKTRIEACIQALPQSKQLLRPPEKEEELSPEEQAEKERVQSLVDGEKSREECSFFFVSADWLLQQTASVPVPPFQDICRCEGAIVQRTLKVGPAFRSELASGELLAISHRWEKPSAPDTEGKQLERIQAHLRANPRLRYVWYDYWCMPQGNRSPSQKLHFGWMLQNVNLLYLGLSVLILLDISYLSRFWTQMEAWLSMQLGGTDGLRPASERLRRCTIETLHTATSTTRDDLIRMWATRTPEEAYTLLSQPDVQVTNQSDKTTQLKKVRGLDPLVCQMHSPQVAAEKLQAGSTWVELVGSGFSPAVVSAMEGVNEVAWDNVAALASELGMGVREICSLPTLDCSRKQLSAKDVRILAGFVAGSASLTKLDLSKNQLCGLNSFGEGTYNAEGITAIADALRVTASLTSLDLYNNSIGAEGAIAIAEGLKDNASLTSLNLADNVLCGIKYGKGTYNSEGIKAIAETLKVTASLTSIDVGYNGIDQAASLQLITAMKGKSMESIGMAGCKLGVEGAKATAELVSVMASLTSLNILSNKLDVESAGVLLKVKAEKPTLRTLCGLTHQETELDFYNEGLGPGDAMLLAPEISVMPSLTSVSLLANKFDDATVAMLLELKKEKPTLSTLCGLTPGQTNIDLRFQSLGPQDAKLLAPEISVMASLTKISLRFNNLDDDAKHIVQKAAEGKQGLVLEL